MTSIEMMENHMYNIELPYIYYIYIYVCVIPKVLLQAFTSFLQEVPSSSSFVLLLRVLPHINAHGESSTERDVLTSRLIMPA